MPHREEQQHRFTTESVAGGPETWGWRLRKGTGPGLRCAVPRTQRGQSEGKTEQGEKSHWLVGAQFEEEKDGKQSGTFHPALSLPPPLSPIKEFQEWE